MSYLSDMMIDLKSKVKWKIQLTVAINILSV